MGYRNIVNYGTHLHGIYLCIQHFDIQKQKYGLYWHILIYIYIYIVHSYNFFLYLIQQNPYLFLPQFFNFYVGFHQCTDFSHLNLLSRTTRKGVRRVPLCGPPPDFYQPSVTRRASQLTTWPIDMKYLVVVFVFYSLVILQAPVLPNKYDIKY